MTYVEINNNPFSPVGRIERKEYIITKIALIAVYFIALVFKSYYKLQ